MYFLLTQSDKKYLRWLYKKIKVSYVETLSQERNSEFFLTL